METNSASGSEVKPVDLTVIVPARNAQDTIARCLEAIFTQDVAPKEVIVVDDCSTDATVSIVERYPVRLIRFEKHRGVAAARNKAAELARSTNLFFVDADVMLDPGAIGRGLRDLAEPGVDAVIGSYDDEPAERSVVSMFKNLAHHHFHQRTGPYVTTFWGACGFVGRDLLLKLGGFNESRRGITDVGLGYRLTAHGSRIRIDPELQVKHLKRWTLPLLVKTDIQVRAIPWTRLLLEYGYLPRGLNFARDQRVAAAVAFMLCGFAALSLMMPIALVGVAICAALSAYINRGLFALFYRKGGLRLLIGGFFLQQLYYFYSGLSMAVGLAIVSVSRLTAPIRRDSKIQS